MWVISAADPAAGVDLVGLDKFVFTQTDQNGQQLLGQDGKPLLDHYELVGYGFGNFSERREQGHLLRDEQGNGNVRPHAVHHGTERESGKEGGGEWMKKNPSKP